MKRIFECQRSFALCRVGRPRRLIIALAFLSAVVVFVPGPHARAATFTITQYIQDNGGAELFNDEFDDGVEPPAGPKTADDYLVNGAFSLSDERTDPVHGGVLDLVTGQGKVDPGDIEKVIGADVKNSAFFFSAGTAGWVQAWFVNSAPSPGSGYGLLIEDFGGADDFALLRILNAGPGPIALFEDGVTGVLAPPVPLNGVLDGSGTIGLRLDLDASGFVTASIDTGGGFADPFGVSSELQLLGAATHTGGFGAAEVIPEPGTVVLFGTGLAGVARWRMRNRKMS